MKVVSTQRSQYAVRALLHLARAGSRVKAADIAGETDIPQGTLNHVLQELQRARLVQGRPSRTGGFTLARPPEEISMLEVVEAVEGPLQTSECVLAGRPCHMVDVCAAHQTWESAYVALKGELACATIADLAGDDGRDATPAAAGGRRSRR